MVKDLRADFVVTALTVTPASPVANNVFTLSATVKNQGAAARPAGYLDVWMNQPTATACGANSDAWLDIGTIAAGASKTVTLSLVAETSGAKTARAFVDSWCETIEANEGNNQRTLSYTVQ
jgi:subtilase family serine protease